MSGFEDLLQQAEAIDNNFHEARNMMRDFLNGKKTDGYSAKIDSILFKLGQETLNMEEELDLIMQNNVTLENDLSEMKSYHERLKEYLSNLDFSEPAEEKPEEIVASEHKEVPAIVIEPVTPAMSAPRSAIKSYSTRRTSPRSQIPDWAMQGSDVNFTPGLFPKGASVNSFLKSASRKSSVKAKHLNF